MFHDASKIALRGRRNDLQHVQKMCCIFRGKRSTLDFSDVILRGRRNTLDEYVACFLRIALSALREGDKAQRALYWKESIKLLIFVTLIEMMVLLK